MEYSIYSMYLEYSIYSMYHPISSLYVQLQDGCLAAGAAHCHSLTVDVIKAGGGAVW